MDGVRLLLETHASICEVPVTCAWPFATGERRSPWQRATAPGACHLGWRAFTGRAELLSRGDQPPAAAFHPPSSASRRCSWLQRCGTKHRSVQPPAPSPPPPKTDLAIRAVALGRSWRLLHVARMLGMSERNQPNPSCQAKVHWAETTTAQPLSGRGLCHCRWAARWRPTAAPQRRMPRMA